MEMATGEDEDHLPNSLQCLDKRRHMSRCSSSDGVKLWAKALGGIDDSQWRFALNRHYPTVPFWLCGRRVTMTPARSVGRDIILIQVLNICKASRDSKPNTTPFYRRLCLSSHHSLPHPPDPLPTWSLTSFLFHLTNALISSAGMMCRRV